jgi:6-pyruvoyltetrahydropterin/6-carboxytetrahydropterin synthase
MEINKKFTYEGAHIVRQCTSKLCSFSLHGHSYTVEVNLTADGLDYGSMLLDFGLLKGPIKDLINSFDHAYSAWNKESDEFLNFIKQNSARYIIMPCSPSAEMYSLMFFYIINNMLKNTIYQNGEKNVQLNSVKVHETATGWAKSYRDDLKYWKWNLDDIIFSDAIKTDWENPMMYDNLINGIKFINPVPEYKKY